MAESLRDQIKSLKEIIDGLRLIVKYLKFDVEATRRERNRYKNLLEKK